MPKQIRIRILGTSGDLNRNLPPVKTARTDQCRQREAVARDKAVWARRFPPTANWVDCVPNRGPPHTAEHACCGRCNHLPWIDTRVVSSIRQNTMPASGLPSFAIKNRLDGVAQLRLGSRPAAGPRTNSPACAARFFRFRCKSLLVVGSSGGRVGPKQGSHRDTANRGRWRKPKRPSKPTPTRIQPAVASCRRLQLRSPPICAPKEMTRHRAAKTADTNRDQHRSTALAAQTSVA